MLVIPGHGPEPDPHGQGCHLQASGADFLVSTQVISLADSTRKHRIMRSEPRVITAIGTHRQAMSSRVVPRAKGTTGPEAASSNPSIRVKLLPPLSGRFWKHQPSRSLLPFSLPPFSSFYPLSIIGICHLFRPIPFFPHPSVILDFIFT